MFKKKLAIFALAVALSAGSAVSAFADTSNSLAIENCGAYLFEWRPVDCGDGMAFAILVGGNTIQGNCSGSGKCRWKMGNPGKLVFHAGRCTANSSDCTENQLQEFKY